MIGVLNHKLHVLVHPAVSYLEGLGLLEGELLQAHHHSHKGLESIGDGVRERGDGRVTQQQWDSSNIAYSSTELGSQIIIRKVQHFGVKDGTIIVDGLDDQPVCEGEDVQLLEQGRLGVPDLQE